MRGCYRSSDESSSRVLWRFYWAIWGSGGFHVTPYSGTTCRLMFGTVYDYEVLGCLELVVQGSVRFRIFSS